MSVELNDLPFCYFASLSQLRLAVDLYTSLSRCDFGHPTGAAQTGDLKQFNELDGVTLYLECWHDPRLSLSDDL